MPTCTSCGEPWDLDSLHDEATARGAPSFRDLPEAAQRSAGRPDSQAHPAYVRYRKAYDAVFQAVRADFQANGCRALGGRCTPAEPGTRAYNRAGIAAEVQALLGDDVDGAEAMMDDAEALGLI